jgi:Domain of unknown function (DUF4184)
MRAASWCRYPGHVPFTVAHAVVAPPLSRWSGGVLPASALVVGAMAPDFEYLVFLQTRRTVGHSPIGLLVFCLPVSLLVLFVWHRVVKRPVAALLPDRWGHLGAALDRPFPCGSWAERAQVVAAVLLGAVSHITSDAFTHAGGVGVALVPWLRTVLPLVGLPAYVVLQYASGLLGMLLLVLFVVAWARNQPRCPVTLPPARHRVVAVTTIVAFTLVVAAGNVARTLAAGPTGARVLLIAAVLGAMTGSTIAVIAYAAGSGGRADAA